MNSVGADSAAAILKGLNVGSLAPDAQPGVLQLYGELKDAYEAQERAAPVEYAGDQDEDIKQACKQASLLFVARVLFAAQQPDGQAQPANLGLSISRIVAAAGINLLDFFREANVVVSRLSAYFESRGSSSKLFCQRAQLKEYSDMVVVMGLLAKKYKDYFNMFLHQLDFYKQVVLRLGWNAFLVLRVKLLVSCMELLPCIFAVLASNAPRLPDSLAHLGSEGRSAALLKAMSDLCKADFKRVQARMLAVEPLLTQILTSAVPNWREAIAAAKAKADEAARGAAAGEAAATGAPALGPGFDLLAHPVLEGLVTDSERMTKAVAALEREYESHYGRGGTELDERDFLSTDFTKFASPRFSPGAMHSAMAKLRAGGPVPLRPGGLLGPGAHTTAPSHPPLSQPMPAALLMGGGVPPGLHSPLPLMHLGGGPGQGPPATPVSEAMGAAAWLRGVTASMAAEPSATLQRYLAAVPLPSAANGGASGGGAPPAPSPAAQLARRVRDMLSAALQDDQLPSLLGPFPLLQPSLAAERRTEALKLYYHSLEAILTAEEKASGVAGVTCLLASVKFHRGLMACCCEVVAACYRMVSCAFPKVLDALRIKAFDLAKMIQSFVKSVATLPRELKRHLFLIEEKILEQLAWEPGSSLYGLLVNVHSEAEAAAAAAAAAAEAAAGAAEAGSAAASGDDSAADGGASSSKAAGPASSGQCGEAGAAGGQAPMEGEQQQQEQQPAQQALAAGGDGGGAVRDSSSQATDQSGAAPMDTAQGEVAPAGEQGAEAAAASLMPARPAQPPPLPAAAPPPSPKRSQASAFSSLMSPAKKVRGAEGAGYASQAYIEALPLAVGPPPPPSAMGGPAAALYDFFRKVLKLVAFRLALMCDNFDFSPLDKAEVNSRVYETIEYAIYNQTHLFYNRHIDQVMLSALYGYCKVAKLGQVSFREIIAQYRKQPQAAQPVFRSVVIEQSLPSLQITSRADIIAFYNQVFVPAMKAFLLKGEASGASGGSGHHLGGAESKPAAAAFAGAPAAALAAVAAAGGGSASTLPCGLPPLPPRSSSQSPRAPKLPPLSGLAGAAAPRLLGRSASQGPAGAVAGGAGREGSERSNSLRERDREAPSLGPVGSSSVAAGTHSPTLLKGEDPHSGQASPTGSARERQGGMQPLPPSSGGKARSRSGGAAAAAAEHKIPDGLAALLQALDSQQVGGDEEAPEEHEEKEPAAPSGRDAQATGPVTRSGRAAAAAAASGAASEGRPGRDRSAGRERRSARLSDGRDDAMDAEGPGTDADAAQPSTTASGRRQRTPNRRYGTD